ncbi:MAG: bifunctional glycosyltransferase family 2/GtrA family protein [Frankia sp.]|nr:bifunctional glycosyltransferase family 2/GtrA family protein [Frankia sp.]
MDGDDAATPNRWRQRLPGRRASRPRGRDGRGEAGEPAIAVLDVVIPVHNEEADLARCVLRLRDYLATTFPYTFQITIADNASTDRTLEIANELADRLPEVAVLHLPAKGRGRALRAAWGRSTAPVRAYMDVDLSTDLRALLPLVAPLLSGHSDLAIGTRLARGARVVRGPKREVISRCYNLLVRQTLATGFSDAQCGFKAVRGEVAARLLPLVQDDGWFFDTELLVLAERAGLRIHEVPVDWVDDPDSRVDIVATALADLRGIARLGRALATGRLPVAQLRRELGHQALTWRRADGVGATPEASGVAAGPAPPASPAVPGVPSGLAGQLVRFVTVGIGSTLAYLALFVLLRLVLGPQAANLVALAVTAVANTAANRRLTFGVTGLAGAGRDHLRGLVIFAIGLGLTSGSLALLHAAGSPGRWLELVAVVLANLVATVVRFLLLRAWVFPGHRQPAGEAREPVPRP